MNHIRTALAAAMLAFGSAAVASAQQTTPTTPRAEHQHQRGGHRGAGMHARKALFEGMTLSTAEQANLKAVRTKYASRSPLGDHDRYGMMLVRSPRRTT